MNVSRCSESKTSLNGCTKIRQDVAEEIVADDYFILPRLEHHKHRHRVDVLMICFDMRISGSDLLKDSSPKIAAEPLHVGLVGHRHSLALVVFCVLKSSDDDSLNAVASVDFFLKSNFVVGTSF